MLLGDGECDEGAVWEAAMSAGHYRLANLVAIVDKNGFQGDGENYAIMDGGLLNDRWASFGWDVRSVDGHNVGELYRAFTAPGEQDRPMAIVANTVKGKGVSFMENNNDWHHNRLTKRLYDRAVSEMDAREG